jgi:hypothetical protein
MKAFLKQLAWCVLACPVIALTAWGAAKFVPPEIGLVLGFVLPYALLGYGLAKR